MCVAIDGYDKKLTVKLRNAFFRQIKNKTINDFSDQSTGYVELYAKLYTLKNYLQNTRFCPARVYVGYSK